MKFREKCKIKNKRIHSAIISDICMNTNNCADCVDSDNLTVDCNPLACVPVFCATKRSFEIDVCNDEKVQRRLIDLAAQHGYKAEISTGKDGIIAIKYKLVEKRRKRKWDYEKELDD